MRTMRAFPWRYVFIAIPIIGVAAGLQYMVRNVVPESSMPEKTMALKPSAFSPTSSEGRRPAGNRAEIARENRQTRAEREEAAAEAVAEARHARTNVAEVADAIENDKHTTPAHVATSEAKRVEDTHSKATTPVTDTSTIAESSVRDPLAERYGLSTTETRAPADISGNVCSAIEYKGDGAEGTKISSEEWNGVLRQFHSVKGELLAWLAEHKKQFADNSVEVMERQLKTMTIQRPPQTDEPDLNWRGIAVFTHDKDGAPQIRMGSGFVKLVQKQPRRGRFEIARTIAQGWAPCELQKRNGGSPWEPLLKCMGMDPNAGCGFGTYSENGWAVSSALAQNVAPAGCAIPAFREGTIGACVKKIPFPLGATAAVESGATVAHAKSN